jgi:hypothetical protein
MGSKTQHDKGDLIALGEFIVVNFEPGAQDTD